MPGAHFSAYDYEADDNGDGCEEHGVEPVEYAAVTGQKFAHILYAAAALDGAFKQIAHLTEYGCGN